MRNTLYIAAGACFAVPIVPFIVWMVRIWQAHEIKQEMDSIKKHFAFSRLPIIQFQNDSLVVALHIKL